MRKPLVALSLALSASIGAIPVAESLAAAPVSSPPINSPTQNEPATHPPSVSGAAIVETAMKYLGYPYTATGNSPATGFSCIGFVSYVYRSNGIALPGDLGGALAFAPRVPFSALLPGDVLYFQNTVWPGLSHAAIYIGGGRFIHAEYYNRGVVISSFNNDPVDGNYWIGKYMAANRPWNGPAAPAAPGAAPAPVTTGSGSPGVTTVTSVATGPTGIVNVSSLYVRTSPSKSGGVVEVIPQGTSVTVLGHRNGWLRVRLPDGNVGWVMGTYISVGSAPGSAATGVNGTVGSPTAPPPAGAPSTTTTTTSTPTTIVVRTGGLSVHSGPSMGSPVVTTAIAGQKLQVIGRQNGWLEVRLPDGTVGWVRAAANGHPGSQTGVTFKRRAPVAMNVRSGPSLTAAVVTVVPAGGLFRISGWSHGWAHVQLPDGTAGWVSGTVFGGSGTTYQSYTYNPPARHPKHRAARHAAVLTASVRVHARPKLSSRVIGLAAAGSRVSLLGHAHGWAHVRLAHGIAGYVRNSYVR